MMQICKVCGLAKPLDEFHRNSTYKNGYASKCKPCAVRLSVQWKKDNRQRANENERRFRERNPKYCMRYYDRDAHTEYSRQWRKNNRDKHNSTVARRRSNNPAKFNEWNRQWMKRHAGKVNAKTAKRRAWRLQCTPAWANFEAIQKFYITAKFVSDATGIKYEVDHIVPLKSKLVCGLHCEANLRIVQKLDNIRKGNRHWPDMP